jgi:proteasome accessory factor A
VIVGDSNMSEYATFLKVGATAILLRMLEDPNVVLRDMTLENPIRAIREISHDITCRARCAWPTGARPAPSRSSREYLDRALRYADHAATSRPQEKQALDMWEHCLTTIDATPSSSTASATG